MSDDIQRVHDELRRRGDAALDASREMKAAAAIKEAEGFAFCDAAQAVKSMLREREKLDAKLAEVLDE